MVKGKNSVEIRFHWQKANIKFQPDSIGHLRLIYYVHSYTLVTKAVRLSDSLLAGSYIARNHKQNNKTASAAFSDYISWIRNGKISDNITINITWCSLLPFQARRDFHRDHSTLFKGKILHQTFARDVTWKCKSLLSYRTFIILPCRCTERLMCPQTKTFS